MYLLMCKKSKLSIDDMKYLSIVMCLDYIDEYFDTLDSKKAKPKKASQTDFDSF